MTNNRTDYCIGGRTENPECPEWTYFAVSEGYPLESLAATLRREGCEVTVVRPEYRTRRFGTARYWDDPHAAFLGYRRSDKKAVLIVSCFLDGLLAAKECTFIRRNIWPDAVIDYLERHEYQDALLDVCQ